MYLKRPQQFFAGLVLLRFVILNQQQEYRVKLKCKEYKKHNLFLEL